MALFEFRKKTTDNIVPPVPPSGPAGLPPLPPLPSTQPRPLPPMPSMPAAQPRPLPSALPPLPPLPATPLPQPVSAAPSMPSLPPLPAQQPAPLPPLFKAEQPKPLPALPPLPTVPASPKPLPPLGDLPRISAAEAPRPLPPLPSVPSVPSPLPEQAPVKLENSRLQKALEELTQADLDLPDVVPKQVVKAAPAPQPLPAQPQFKPHVPRRGPLFVSLAQFEETVRSVRVAQDNLSGIQAHNEKLGVIEMNTKNQIEALITSYEYLQKHLLVMDEKIFKVN